MGEHALHDRLTVVEGAIKRKGMHIGIRRRRHLTALDIGHAPVGKQDEDVGAVTPAEGLDGSPAGVTGRGAHDGGATIPLGEHVIHHAAQKLHGHVLEGERWTMEQFKDKTAGSYLHKRRHGLVAETRIGFVDHRGQIVARDLSRNERRDHRLGDLRIGTPGEACDRSRGQTRPFGRNIQATVGGETGQENIGKSQCRCLAPRTHIFHDPEVLQTVGGCRETGNTTRRPAGSGLSRIPRFCLTARVGLPAIPRLSGPWGTGLGRKGNDRLLPQGARGRGRPAHSRTLSPCPPAGKAVTPPAMRSVTRHVRRDRPHWTAFPDLCRSSPAPGPTSRRSQDRK